jgi:peptidoglycan/LPS O-acetylase OafA/YrhL
MTGSPSHINALTTLRFFAALLVVVFHHGQSAFAAAPSWCQSLTKGGYAGVPFFFVLSGFILAYNYLPKAREGTLDKRRFWVARFARVYPVYAVALLVSAPIFWVFLWQTMSPDDALSRFGVQAVLSFGLIQSWIPSWAFAWNGPAWSLSVEALFYLTFPFLMKHLNEKARWGLLAGFFSAAVALLMAGRVFGCNAIASAQQVLGWANPLLWLPLFVLGICMGELRLKRTASPPIRGKRAAWLAVFTVSLMALIVLAMTSSLQRKSQLLLCYAVAAPCALLILLLSMEGNPISGFLGGSSLVLMGEASYSLYILHRPIHDWFGWIEKHGAGFSTGTTAGFAWYLATCLILSVLTLKWIEYPCRDWIKRWYSVGSRPRTRTSSLPETCAATLR